LRKVVGIIGHKDSGKTTLARALVQELTGRGYEVAVVKHLSHRFDLPGKDTTILGEVASQVGFTSPQGSGVLWKKPKDLEDIIPYLEADIILVEGFKSERTYPKIVCLRGRPEDRDLFDGLAICAVGPADPLDGLDVLSFGGPSIPLLGRDEVSGIADLVEEKAFKLPGLDCGACGYERCYEMARQIVAGTGDVENCVP
jgi:molybdopterin-guanine dinucleotide biosynthesis protein B